MLGHPVVLEHVEEAVGAQLVQQGVLVLEKKGEKIAKNQTNRKVLPNRINITQVAKNCINRPKTDQIPKRSIKSPKLE